jgi:hypothetical protein
VSYNGGPLGICRIATLLNKALPVRLFSRRYVIRQYDRPY